MATRRIMIVCQHALFREGLRRLVADVPDAELLAAVSSLAEAEALATASPPDVIIVNQQDENQEILACLLGLTQAQVVTVALADSEMNVYSRQRVTEATMQDLLTALENNQEGGVE